jgi:hypothetical protein
MLLPHFQPSKASGRALGGVSGWWISLADREH